MVISCDLGNEVVIEVFTNLVINQGLHKIILHL